MTMYRVTASVLFILLGSAGCTRDSVAGRSLESWRADLKSGDYERQRKALQGLAEAGPSAAPLTPDIVSVAADPKMTHFATLALSFMGKEGAAPLRELAGDSTVRVRKAALHQLGRLQSRTPLPAVEVLPTLLANVADPDREIRAVAVYAIGYVKQDADTVIPVLVRALLDDESPFVRRNAAMALDQYGSLAKAAVPALKKALDDPDAETRDAAKNALRHHQ